MSNHIVQYCTTKSRRKCENVQNGWGPILADAEGTLRYLQSRIRHLKRGIRIIRGKIETGEALPDYIRAIMRARAAASSTKPPSLSLSSEEPI